MNDDQNYKKLKETIKTKKILEIIEALLQEDFTTGFTIVQEAEDNVSRNWAGSGKVFYDVDTNLFWLPCRMRIRHEQGHEIRILRSTDGITFTTEDILLKENFSNSFKSLEECQIFKNPNSGKWQLFFSGNETTNGWEIYKLTDIDDIDTDKFDQSTDVKVLSRGSPSEWDDVAIKGFKIDARGNEYVMLYSGKNNR